MEELPQTFEETFQEEPSQEQEQEEQEAAAEEEPFQEVRKRGRPRMTPEQKKEAKLARAKLKVVVSNNEPAKEPKPTKPKIIERVVREYVEVPVPAVQQQQSPFESITNVLRSRVVSDYERKKQQWASFQLI